MPMFKLSAIALIISTTIFLHAADGQPSSFFLLERVVVRMHPDKGSKLTFKPQCFSFNMELHKRKLILLATPADVVNRLSAEIIKLQLKHEDVNRKEVCVEKELDFFTCIDEAYERGFNIAGPFGADTMLEEVREKLEKDKHGNLILDAYVNSPQQEIDLEKQAAKQNEQEDNPQETAARPTRLGCWRALARFLTSGLPF